MKINKSLSLVFMVLVSLCLISAVSAADNASDVIEVSDANEVQAIENVDESIAVENDAVLESTDVAEEPTLSVDESAADSTLGINFTFGGNGGNSTKFNFSSISFDLGNGTSFDLGSLLNGTTLSFGNGTSINTSDLLNGNMSFGNGTSIDLGSLLNMTGNGTGSFDMSSLTGLLGGGTKITFNATDINKVYSGKTTFKVKVLDGDKPVASQQSVIFTVDNKEYVERTDENGTATISLNLAAGTHFVYTEYNNVIGKNKIVITKAATKITASKKTFKSKTKTKKYTITLKVGKKALKNAKVTLKIKGKTFTAKTNSNGKATFKITKLTKKGKYSAKIRFAGNGYYKASTASKTITIK